MTSRASGPASGRPASAPRRPPLATPSAPPFAPPPSPDLRGRSLLAVFAHPDDESLACGGLLALCAAHGARVSLLCLTHGEHGPGGAAPALGEARARELREAARVLGVHEVVLADHEDGMLPWIDAEVLDADVLDAVRRARPDVVVTFDSDGLYWHPDHVAVHERVTAAVASLGAEAPALRYVSLPREAMRAVVDAAGPGPILGVEDPDGFGAMAPPASYAVDVGAFAVRKLAALRCHRSQVAGGPLDRLDPADVARLLGTEHVRRAEEGSAAEAFIDRLGGPLSSSAT